MYILSPLRKWLMAIMYIFERDYVAISQSELHGSNELTPLP